MPYKKSESSLVAVRKLKRAGWAGGPEVVHYVADSLAVSRHRVVCGEDLVQRLISVIMRIGESLGNGVDALLDAHKPVIPIAPAENVVVVIGLATAAFDESNTGQKPPIEVVTVGCGNEIFCQRPDGTLFLFKKAFQAN